MNGDFLKLPFLSIPFVFQIDDFDIGFWIWTKKDNEKHCVFIECRDEILIAGADLAGERLIAGIWRGAPGRPLYKILDYSGKYAKNMNPDLSDDEITERIWDFIQGQAITMTLIVTQGREVTGSEGRG